MHSLPLPSDIAIVDTQAGPRQASGRIEAISSSLARACRKEATIDLLVGRPLFILLPPNELGGERNLSEFIAVRLPFELYVRSPAGDRFIAW